MRHGKKTTMFSHTKLRGSRYFAPGDSNFVSSQPPVALLTTKRRPKMGLVDIILMIVIIAGAVYLLYRSLWKKKGHCPGCDSETCKPEKKYNPKDC